MKIDILGVHVDNLKKSEILQQLKSYLGTDKRVFIVTPYSEFIVAAQTDMEFRNVLNSAELALPDGIGMLWAAKYLELRIKNHESRIYALIKTLSAIVFNSKYIRSPIPEKISGSNFIWDLAKLAADNGKSIFLLGGFDNTPEIAAHKLQTKLPGLKISGTSNFIANADSQSQINILDKINSSNTDFLFVALGPIRQEKWIFENLPKLRVNLAIGLGGTFDYLAGIRPPAPDFWASRGLEWLWRLLTQPWRLWRIMKGVFGLIYYCFLFSPR